MLCVGPYSMEETHMYIHFYHHLITGEVKMFPTWHDEPDKMIDRLKEAVDEPEMWELIHIQKCNEV